ncbi:MAG: GNAT family N-acetyltransferase [Promethearchaeota archaeon]
MRAPLEKYRNISQNIEMKSLNAWPSLQTLFYDGWIIRFADGYTKRANSVNPIFSSFTEIPVNIKIQKVRDLFKNQNLPLVFKITPTVNPISLDQTLEKQKFIKIDETSVQTISLGEVKSLQIKNLSKSNSLIPEFHVFKDLDKNWFSIYCNLNDVNSKSTQTLELMLNLIILPKFFACLTIKEEILAVGIGVLERDYIGLFGIAVDENYRNRGLGRMLMQNLFKLGIENKAKYAYLQVMTNNSPALHLYNKLGFKEEYKYWYRKELI